MLRTILTIAGHDPTGGAGVKADVETFIKLGVPYKSIITALTHQTHTKVVALNPVHHLELRDYLESVVDESIRVVKIGMIGSRANVEEVIHFLNRHTFDHVIIDPVFESSSGYSLIDSDAMELFITQLLPLAALITPNLDEAETLADQKIRSVDDMSRAAKKLFLQFNHPAILIKGGDLATDAAVDIFYDGKRIHEFKSPRIAATKRGTGCRLASAIGAYLLKGDSLPGAIYKGRIVVREYLSLSI